MRTSNVLTPQRRLMADLVSAALESGMVAADAVRRAEEAAAWLRSTAREHGTYSLRRRLVLREYVVAAMRSRGAESGTTLAARAIEAERLTELHFGQFDKHRPHHLGVRNETEAEEGEEGAYV